MISTNVVVRLTKRNATSWINLLNWPTYTIFGQKDSENWFFRIGWSFVPLQQSRWLSLFHVSDRCNSWSHCGELFKNKPMLEDFCIDILKEVVCPKGFSHKYTYWAFVLTKIKYSFEQDGCMVGFQYNRNGSLVRNFLHIWIVIELPCSRKLALDKYKSFSQHYAADTNTI